MLFWRYVAQVTKRVLAAMTLLLLSGAMFLPWGSGGLAAVPAELSDDEESVGRQSLPVSLSQLGFEAGVLQHMLDPNHNCDH